MKEHFQDYGIRKWAGNDLIELQSEPMEALQKLVEPYAPCILQGCEITEGDDAITIAAGLVALQGKDYKGEDCVKIVRFAGVADKTPPVYLTLECEPEKRVYGDSQSKAIAYNYKAVATIQKPEGPYLKITTDDNKRLVDTLGITQKLDMEEAQKGIVSFTKDAAEKHTNIQSGSTLGNLFGKIERWFDDLKALAFKDKVGKEDFNDNLKTDFDNKVDKINGKGLSTNDFTTDYKTKLDGIAKGAEVNVQVDWGEIDTTSDAFIKNKPTALPANGGTATTISSVLPLAKGGTGATTAPDAVNNLLKNASLGSTTPTDDAYIIASGNGTSNTSFTKKPLSKLWLWIKSKLSTVATSGSYNDLTDKPTIPSVDTALSATSTNPVQNKVIKTALDGKAASSHTHSYLPLSGGTVIGDVTMQGKVRLQKKQVSGSTDHYLSPRLNFGDSDEVYMEEGDDGYLTIYAKNGINIPISLDKLKVNGSHIFDLTTKLIGPINSNRAIQPGQSLALNGNNVKLTIEAATEFQCKTGLRTYIYQSNTSNCTFDISNINEALCTSAAKNQITISGNTITLKQAMGLWTITWTMSGGIWIDFDSMNTIVK